MPPLPGLPPRGFQPRGPIALLDLRSRVSGWALPILVRLGDRAEERLELRGILAARRRLGAAGAVDRERVLAGDALPHVVRRQATGQDDRHVTVVRRDEVPLERLARAA